jgi:adenine-specific DNA methylase
MKILSSIAGRVRIEFDNILEKKQFLENIRSLNGIVEIKESSKSITVNYNQNTQFDYFLKNFILPSIENKRTVEKIDKDDIHYYIAPLLKSNVVKALWSVSLLGFKRGFLTFTICSLGVSAYLKNKF